MFTSNTMSCICFDFLFSFLKKLSHPKIWHDGYMIYDFNLRFLHSFINIFFDVAGTSWGRSWVSHMGEGDGNRDHVALSSCKAIASYLSSKAQDPI